MFFQSIRRGNNSWASYFTTVVLVFIGYSIVGVIPLTVLQYYKIKTDSSLGSDELRQFSETMDFSILNVDKNLGLVMMIMVFVASMFGLYIGVKYFHKIPFRHLITPLQTINYRKIVFAFLLWGALLIGGEFMSYMLNPDHYTWNLKLGRFLVLALICFLLLPIQTTMEELFFRGYLMPAIGQITSNKWLPLIISSILFAAVHLMNPEVEKFGYGIMITYYMCAALFLGLITIWDDSLELAIGVHAATNVFSALLITFEGSVLQTDAMFRLSETDPYLMTFIFLIASIVFIYIAGRRYGWEYRSLFADIEKENYV